MGAECSACDSEQGDIQTNQFNYAGHDGNLSSYNAGSFDDPAACTFA